MRNHSNIIFILNGCRHSDCSRTPSQAVSLKEPVAEIFVDIFAAMRGDIDIFRIKFSKSVDCLIELFRFRFPSKEGEFRKRKLSLLLCIKSITLILFR